MDTTIHQIDQSVSQSVSESVIQSVSDKQTSKEANKETSKQAKWGGPKPLPTSELPNVESDAVPIPIFRIAELLNVRTSESSNF